MKNLDTHGGASINVQRSTVESIVISLLVRDAGGLQRELRQMSVGKVISEVSLLRPAGHPDSESNAHCRGLSPQPS